MPQIHLTSIYSFVMPPICLYLYVSDISKYCLCYVVFICQMTTALVFTVTICFFIWGPIILYIIGLDIIVDETIEVSLILHDRYLARSSIHGMFKPNCILIIVFCILSMISSCPLVSARFSSCYVFLKRWHCRHCAPAQI